MKLGDDKGEFKNLFGAAKSAYISVNEFKKKNRIEIGKQLVSFSCKKT